MKKKRLSIISLVGLLVLAGTAVALLVQRTKSHRQKPPAGAPQLAIENPGHQSDFPATPTGEKNLG